MRATVEPRPRFGVQVAGEDVIGVACGVGQELLVNDREGLRRPGR